MSVPLYMIFPSVGIYIPAMSFAKVDFPLPFGPVIATNLSSILRFTSFNIDFPSFVVNPILLSSNIKLSSIIQYSAYNLTKRHVILYNKTA